MPADFAFLKGNIETIILNALYNGDKYGYEIAKEIKEKTENQYEIKQPTLYAYLKRLQNNGLIVSYWGAESNGGRRRYYKLTQEGRTNFERFSAEWKYHRNVMDNLVDVDENALPNFTQEEATPLFGTKTKRTRKKGVSVNDYDEQEAIAQKLAELDSQRNATVSVDTQEQQQSIVDKAETEVNANVDEQSVNKQTEETQQTFEQYSQQPEHETVVVEHREESSSNYTDTNTREDIFQQETIFSNVQNLHDSEELKVKIVASEQADQFITTATIADAPTEEELAKQQETFSNSRQNSNDNVMHQQTDAGQCTVKDYNSNFDVQQDSVEQFMHNFDQKISEMSAKKEAEKLDDIDYQNVLLNVVGDQLQQMEDYKNSTPDAMYQFTAERPIALEDVADEFAKQGIRMRIYNRTTAVYRPKKLIPLNKIYAISSWLTFAVIAIICGVIMLATSSANTWIGYSVTLGILCVLPLIFTFYCMSDPSRKQQPDVKFKLLYIITAICAVVVILLTFGINILFFDIKFVDIGSVALRIGIPCVLAIIPLVFVAIFNVVFVRYTKK